MPEIVFLHTRPGSPSILPIKESAHRLAEYFEYNQYQCQVM